MKIKVIMQANDLEQCPVMPEFLKLEPGAPGTAILREEQGKNIYI